jgi:hypothetical protein
MQRISRKTREIMAASDDINTLFRRFGGNAGSYQEIVARDQADAAGHKWPLLSQIRPFGDHEVLATSRDLSDPGARVAQPPEPIRERVVVLPRSPEPEVQVAQVPEVSSAEPAVLLAAAPVVDVPPAATEVRREVAPPRAVFVQTPPSVAATPAVVVETVPAAGKTELQRMFGRMLPARPVQVAPAAAQPLKRLIKW